VDRERFSAFITEALDAHPKITRRSEIVDAVPAASADHPVVLATGPLTGDALAADLAQIVGAEHLAYYDAIAPIISADSINWQRVFKQSRWGKSEASLFAAGQGKLPEGEHGELGADTDLGDEAYVNCPFDEAQYKAFVAALVAAEKVEPRSFEKTKYFEGCLPVEVMAMRGEMTLSFGPMKPVGLTDPRTLRRPYAVVQLRPEDEAKTAYNMVGFQTRMTYAAQNIVLRMIPGLEEAEILRYGTVHRNTFVNSPAMLDGTQQLRARANVYLAGQITGVEGYVESAASGLLCGIMLAQKLLGLVVTPPPADTCLGGLLTHIQRAREGEDFQPSNITWACLPPHPNRKLKKRDRYLALSEKALVSNAQWLASAPTMKPWVAPYVPAHVEASAIAAPSL
jgi:methylenetetrahydrofolate--tRNA-(uracil-5-)-methyltransferase